MPQSSSTRIPPLHAILLTEAVRQPSSQRLHEHLIPLRVWDAMMTVCVAWIADCEQRKQEVEDQPAEATAGEAAAIAGEAPPHAPQACLRADWQRGSLHVLPAAATMPAAPVSGFSWLRRSLSFL